MVCGVNSIGGGHRLRSYISYDELEELGETIVRAYINKTRRYNTLCVDIEGLVTDYLGLTVVYETIAEDDPNKIAFLSNGKRPLCGRGSVIVVGLKPA